MQSRGRVTAHSHTSSWGRSPGFDSISKGVSDPPMGGLLRTLLLGRGPGYHEKAIRGLFFEVLSHHGEIIFSLLPPSLPPSNVHPLPAQKMARLRWLLRLCPQRLLSQKHPFPGSSLCLPIYKKERLSPPLTPSGDLDMVSGCKSALERGELRPCGRFLLTIHRGAGLIHQPVALQRTIGELGGFPGHIH